MAILEIDHKNVVLSTFILFVQTAQEVLKYIDAHLYRKTRLSMSKLIILQVLARSSDGMMPSEIARWTSTERHNITALVNRMKEQGLVTAERDRSNRRLVRVKLTDKGREAGSQALPVAREIVDRIMASITTGDVVLLGEKLKTIRQNAHYGLEYLNRDS